MSEMSKAERRELQEFRAAKRQEAARGIVDKRAVELGDEIMRPIGVRVLGGGPKSLKTNSRADLHEQLRDVIERGKENELYAQQTGWGRDAQIDALNRKADR